MRPARAGSTRKLAIFLDGWTYHKDRVGQDLRQRMALLASGNWDVWSFTWQDVDEKLGLDSAADPPELAIPDLQRLKTMLQKMQLAQHANIGTQPVFEWFEAELLGDGLPWGEIGKCVLAARMAEARVVDLDTWQAFVAGVAPPVAHDPLQGLLPRLITRDACAIHPHFALMAVHDGNAPALVCTLDDGAELHEAPEYKAAWRGYLRLFQLLRHTPNAWFMTRTGTAEGELYAPIGAMHGIMPDGVTWSGFGDIEPEFQAVARHPDGGGGPRAGHRPGDPGRPRRRLGRGGAGVGGQARGNHLAPAHRGRPGRASRRLGGALRGRPARGRRPRPGGTAVRPDGRHALITPSTAELGTD